ncbi:MAG TPA: alpha/beta hydrolase [Planctomycetota bacterium]|nr:alpha/beta hydrolase [Planctomycetota bacterium]
MHDLGPRLVEERTVRASDGTELYARRTRGADAAGVPLVCCNGIGVATFFWKYVERHFAQERPVILWDYRGHGESGAPPSLDNLTMEQNARDLLSVLDAFGVEKAALAGHSMGVQVILEFYRQWPERTAALVPTLGTFGKPVHTFLDAPILAPLAFLLAHKLVIRSGKRLAAIQRSALKKPFIARLAARIARLARLVHPAMMPQADLEAYLAHFGDFDPEVFFRMAEKMALHSAESVLPTIHVPTLVIAGERDIFTPLHLSEEMADRIPGARLLVIPQGSHAALVEQPQLLCLAMEKLLRDNDIDGVKDDAQHEAVRISQRRGS